MVVRRRGKVAAALLLALVSCYRKPPDSPQFEEAFALYNQLYAKSLDDSYGEPQMARVAELLRQVEPKSAQGLEAKDLLTKVERGMMEYHARAERLAAMAASADVPVEFKGGGTVLPTSTAVPPPAAAAAPALGMTRDEFLARFADCFDRKGDYEQGDKRGEAFAVRPGCAERYPTFANALVVLIDNRVTQLVPTKDVKVLTVDAGEAVPAVAAPVAPPAVPPPTPPAPVRYYPGQPRPDLAGEAPPAPAP
jgi:hypothetical protein